MAFHTVECDTPICGAAWRDILDHQEIVLVSRFVMHYQFVGVRVHLYDYAIPLFGSHRAIVVLWSELGAPSA